MGFHFRKQKHLKRVFLNDPRTSDPYHRPDSPIPAWVFIQEMRVGCVGSKCFNSFSFFFKPLQQLAIFLKNLHFVTKASNKNTKCLQMSCCTIKSRQLICCCCTSHIWDMLSCAWWQMGVYIRHLSAQCQRLASTKCSLKCNVLMKTVFSGIQIWTLPFTNCRTQSTAVPSLYS